MANYDIVQVNHIIQCFHMYPTLANMNTNVIKYRDQIFNHIDGSLYLLISQIP